MDKQDIIRDIEQRLENAAHPSHGWYYDRPVENGANVLRHLAAIITDIDSIDRMLACAGKEPLPEHLKREVYEEIARTARIIAQCAIDRANDVNGAETRAAAGGAR